MILASGPIGWLLFVVGNNDPFLIAGGLLVGFFGRHYWSVIPGAAIAILGNPELALAMTTAGTIVCLASPFRRRLGPMLLSVAISGIAVMSLTTWAVAVGSPTRSGLLLVNLKTSLMHFAIQLPLVLYSGLGLSLFVLVWAILRSSVRDGVCIFAGAVAIPVWMTAITTDGTRVLVCSSLIAVAVVTAHFGPSLYLRLRPHLPYPLTITAEGIVFAPAIVLQGRFVISPWEYIYPVVQAYLIDGAG